MGTALIAIGMTDRTASPAAASGRPRANFLTQMIATAQRVPQTRARRRAEPDQAIAAYGATARCPAPSGRALTRSF
jgi:hypothetical protein